MPPAKTPSPTATPKNGRIDHGPARASTRARAGWLAAGAAGFAAAAGIVLLAARLAGASPGWRAAGLAAGSVLTAALTYGLHRTLGAIGVPAPASYRTAFLAGTVFGSMVILASGLSWVGSVLGVLGAALGAFVGGLTASARDYGLWEDNQPPGSDIIERVRRAHAARIGDDPRVPPGKVVLDRLGAAAATALALPVGVVLLIGLWLEDPGPLFFVKNSVGRGGRNFRQWKIRTMVRGAESESGPVPAERGDERVLTFGRLLRRTALDELPQLVNILVGQMSLVGPRPQRTVLVAEYLTTLPEYAERHRLPPGLAGLAQVAGHYYLTPRQKLRFDRLYLKHAGLGFDLRLILIALGVVFWLRWIPGWNGRLPRAWLHRRPG